MSNLKEFNEYLESKVGNSLYVWGAQGESMKSVVRTWVKGKENSANNVNRVMAFLDKMLPQDFYFYDCSGLGVDWLLKQGLISSDMTAAGLYNLCTKISKSQLQCGDWVFLNQGGKIGHIGYVVDNNLNVIECKGRAYGVIKQPLPKGSWNAFGRPDKLFPELKEGSASNNSNVSNASKISIGRILKLTNPRMRGEDIETLQEVLKIETDGVFGPATEAAVKAIQKKLFPSDSKEWDGKAGKKTIESLGLKWIE